jgi:hypothetical protein
MANHPNRSKREERPLRHLQLIGKQYPNAWKEYDQFRQIRGKDGFADWPDWCYCPLAAAYAIISGGGNNRVALVDAGKIGLLGAFAAWRVTQSIYRFDPVLAAALSDTPIDTVPVEVLYRLPEWCVYVEVENHSWFTAPMAGFFAHLEHDAVTGRPELRLVIDLDDEFGQPMAIAVPIHLNQQTLEKQIESMLAESRRQMITEGATSRVRDLSAAGGDMLADEIRPLLGMLLYLCSEQPDLGDFSPSRPEPKRTKNGWRLFPPDRPRIIMVGVEIGDELRSANLDEQLNRERKGQRPHIRRAHWHTYLTGPGRSVPLLKWLPPIPVNLPGDRP